MKKLLVIVQVLLVLLLVGCTNNGNEFESNEWAVLPDLNGYNETEVILALDELGFTYQIEYFEESRAGYDLQFIMYQGKDTGDVVNLEDKFTVVVYPLSDNYFILPIIEMLHKDNVIDVFQSLGVSYYFDEVETEFEVLDGDVISYSEDYEAGDVFSKTSAIGIKIYKFIPSVSLFFSPVDLPYDGPYLDSSFDDIDYMDPRGGHFDAPLTNCTDGDTAKFYYPQDIYDVITSGAKSVRFLNMDTEETYPGGEEEWGKPASKYTCSILNSAISIRIQTDPNESLIDTHGRLLGWIWVQLEENGEYQLLNYMVVRQGLAQVKYEFGGGETIYYGDYTYNEWMHIAEDKAQNEELGQWGNLLDYYWNYIEDEPIYSRW